MRCDEVLALLGDLSRGANRAQPPQIRFLLDRGLVTLLDPYFLEIYRLALDEAGAEGARMPLPALLDPGKFQIRLRALEHDLRSDLHRATTGAARLWEEERTRSRLRMLVGVLGDPALAPRLAETVQQAAALGKAPLVPCAGLPFLLALTPLGQQAGSSLYERRARFAQKPFDEFYKQFKKSEDKLDALARSAAWLTEAVGPVPRNKHQIVVGLIKSGLPPEQAASAFQQGMRHNRLGTKNEPPHLATALVRSAAQQRHELAAEARRLAEAAALLTRRFGDSPTTRGAAKTLLPFADLQQGLARLVQLRDGAMELRLDTEESLKAASRLMGVADATPRDLLLRLRSALRELSQGPLRQHPRARAVAVAIAATAPDAAATHRRLLALLAAYQARPLPPGAEPLDLALDSLGCPGEPPEVVSTVVHAAARFAAQQRSAVGPSHLATACAFARQITF